jgi:hypothetical protein
MRRPLWTAGHCLLPARRKPHVADKIVFKYSVFHWAAFTVMGVIASFCLRLATPEPRFGFGVLLFFVLFIVFEFGFRLVRATLFSQQAGLAWTQVLIGNLLASTAIGVYLLRRHRPVATT